MLRRTAISLMAATCLLLSAGCAVEREARLYPANDAATPGGILQAKFIAQGTGNGTVEIVAPDGELYKGEYSIVRDGSVGFESVIAAVFGTRGMDTGSGFGMSSVTERGSLGRASAIGSNGTRMQCEFHNDDSSRHGYGVCESSRGGLYRLQY